MTSHSHNSKYTEQSLLGCDVTQLGKLVSTFRSNTLPTSAEYTYMESCGRTVNFLQNFLKSPVVFGKITIITL
jgi:hypothetical protein